MSPVESPGVAAPAVVARSPGRPLRLAGWILAALLLSAHFALNFQHNARPYLDADLYTHYEAKRPYQYRLLMAPVMGALIAGFERPGPRAALARLPAFVATPDAAAYLLINTAALTVSCFLMAAIARRVFGTGPPGPVVAVAVYLALVYAYFCLNPNLAFVLPYDVPGLALSQAALLCILTRRWSWLYPVFVLGVLNRETVFLVIVFLAAQALLDDGAGERRRALRHAIGLSAVWIVVKFGLYWRFAALPSDEGLRVLYNLRTLAKPWQWPSLVPLLASVGLALASLRRARVQRAWAVTGGIGFLLVFAVGQITETRAFADLTTYLAIAIALGGSRAASRPDPAPTARSIATGAG